MLDFVAVSAFGLSVLPWTWLMVLSWIVVTGELREAQRPRIWTGDA
ncbi:MAG: hypothetical protein AAF662_06830 [Pseudomonadota bacterium]